MKLLFFSLFCFVSVNVFSQTPEITGKWKTNGFLGVNANAKFILQKAINDDKYENKYGLFVEINEDFTFSNYYQGWCGNGCDLEIKGKYSLDTNNHITFYLNQFIYNGLGCKGQKKLKPFTKTYSFEVNDGILILKQ